MSPFAALVGGQRVKLSPWPQHRRRSHRLMVQADRQREPDDEFDVNYIAGAQQKVRIRAAKIAEFIRARKQVTALELCPLVGASRRTIYRDVQLLVEAGAPIRGCPEHGYRWEEAK